ncbi:MAG: DUF4012 domain-containing protein [Actinomycetota bacterium]|nr:DUF4012 domain-containing protein [Actinomycetota bacterium]
MLVLLLVADGIYVGMRLESSLRAAADDLDEGGDLVRDVELANAQRSFVSALQSAESARSATGHPAFALASLVPPLSEDLNAVDVLADVAGNAARAGISVVDGADALGADEDGLTGTVFREGRIRFDALSEAEPFLAEAAETFEESSELLSSLGNPRFGAVREALTEARERVDDAHRSASRAQVLFDALPGLFARNGTRRYLLAFQSPSEARATGGLIGLYGILSAENGRLRLDDISYIRDLLRRPLETVGAPHWFREHYGPLDALRSVQQVNESPHFPVVSEVLLSIYESKKGTRPDGVIAMDPIALGYMLEGMEPLRAPGLDVDVTSENAAQIILHDSYLEFPTPEAQNLYLGDLIGQFWTRVQEGDVRPGPFAQGFAKAVRTQHVKVYSGRAADQEALQALDAEGDYSDEGDHVQMLFHNNYAANKVDYFLERQVDTSIRLQEDGGAHVTVSIDLTNNSPAGPASDLLGRFSFKGYPPGFNGMFVNLIMPREATVYRFLQNGEQSPYILDEDDGFPVAWDLVELDPGESSNVTIRYRVPSVFEETPQGARYQLKLLPQALVRPDGYTVEVFPPQDMEIVDDGSGAVEDGVLRLEGVLEEELLVEVRVVDA